MISTLGPSFLFSFANLHLSMGTAVYLGLTAVPSVQADATRAFNLGNTPAQIALKKELVKNALIIGTVIHLGTFFLFERNWRLNSSFDFLIGSAAGLAALGNRNNGIAKCMTFITALHFCSAIIASQLPSLIDRVQMMNAATQF